MLVQIPLLIVAIALSIPCTVLLIECLSAFAASSSKSLTRSSLAVKEQKDEQTKDKISIAVLMPAHNESAVIAQTLTALMPQIGQQDRLIVVADNCTDDTAQLARQAGAMVLERTDPERRGKGYALDYGVQFMHTEPSAPPAAVVVVDADCQFRCGSVRDLAMAAIAHQRPVQGVYLMELPTQPSLKQSVSVFAFKVKNWVRPLGLLGLNLPCLLTGTGMAFPWPVMQSMDLASGSIVEDMKLGFDLAIAQSPPLLCSSVTVVGPLPPSDAAAKTQRTRWEHGHLQIMSRYCPQLLAQAVKQRRWDLGALALDLCIPPLSLLVMLWFSVSALVTLAAAVSGFWLPVLICYGSGMGLSLAIMSACAGFAQGDLSLKTLISVPLYILWKVPLYLKFLTQPQIEWVRTHRETQQNSNTIKEYRD